MRQLVWQNLCARQVRHVEAHGYSASKGPVTALTMASALDRVADNIRIDCWCRGSIDTVMIRTLFRNANDAEALREAVTAKHPIGQLARAD